MSASPQSSCDSFLSLSPRVANVESEKVDGDSSCCSVPSLTTGLRDGQQARGSMWVGKIYDAVDFEKYSSSETFRGYMSTCPYKKGSRSLLRKVYEIIATASVECVSSFLGVACCPDNSRCKETASLYANEILTRGNVCGRLNDNFRTNESFLRRQCDFLEFLDRNPHWKTSVEELAVLATRSVDDLLQYTWSLDERVRHSLVTEDAAIAYIEEKNTAKQQSVGQLWDTDGDVVDLSELTIDAANDIGNAQPKKRKKELKGYVRASDLGSYKSALCELQQYQLKMLGVEGMITPLRSSLHFQKYVKTKVRAGKHHEMMHKMDKGSDALSDTPSKETVARLLYHWINTTGDCNKIHAGVMNACAYMGMCLGGLLRGDSLLRQTYSDMQIIRHSDHATPPTLFDITYFVITSNQSKTNRSGNLDCNCKICGMEIASCPVMLEGLMMIMRHDILKIPIPDGTKVVRVDSTTVHRPWHDDYVYANPIRGSDLPYRVRGREFPQIDRCLKTPVCIDSMAKGWRADFAEIGINADHTIHLCRSSQALKNGFLNIDLAETARMGKWGNFDDNMCRSYTHLPSTGTLVKLCGAESVESYKPFHLLIKPPEELVTLVLPMFQKELKNAQQRNDLARKSADEGTRLFLQDTGYVRMCQYALELSRVFVQCSPYLPNLLRSDHPIIMEHALFQHNLFRPFAAGARILRDTLARLDVEAPHSLAQFKRLGFQAQSEGHNVTIRPSIARQDEELKTRIHNVFDTICEKISELINSGEPQSEVQNLAVDVDAVMEALSADFFEKVDRFWGANVVLIEPVQATETMRFEEVKHDVSMLKEGFKTTLLTRGFAKRSRIEAKETIQDEPAAWALIGLDSSILTATGSEKRPEINRLTPLGSMSKLARPVKHVYELWTVGDGTHRAIKDICVAPLPGHIRWPTNNRSIQNIVQKIRCISVVVDLLKMEGMSGSVAIEKLEIFMKENGMQLDRLAKMIAAELKNGGVTKPREAIDAQSIFRMNCYATGSFFWKDL